MSVSRLTLRGAPLVVAPGKLFLAGEYAVLHGYPAVVTAVSRKAVAQYVPGLEPESPVVASAVRLAIASLDEAAGALPAGSVLIHTTEFQQDDRKLGLGSSAATAAATVGAVFEYCGYSITDHEDVVFEVADRAHREAQGGVGSGADVAAAVHGGVLHFQRTDSAKPAVRRALMPLAGLHIVAFQCGDAVSTPQMLQRVAKLQTDRPPLHKWLIDELGSAATAFAESYADQDGPGAVAAARACLEAMRELGHGIDRPIVTPAFDAAAKLATELHGAAKPSGAGGGDVGVALFTTAEDAARFKEGRPEGVTILDLETAAPGLRRRRAAIVAVEPDAQATPRPGLGKSGPGLG